MASHRRAPPSVQPRGIGRYCVIVECLEFAPQMTDSEHIPTAYVELRSDFIREVAFLRSFAVVSKTVVQRLNEAQVSRIDLCADCAGWVVTYADYPGSLTSAKRDTDASDATECETSLAGKTNRRHASPVVVGSSGNETTVMKGAYCPSPVARVRDAYRADRS